MLPYNPILKHRARALRSSSTLSEVLLWRELKGKRMRGFDFHRQKPIDEFIVDFYCPALMLAIEIDGESHSGRTRDDENRQQRIESFGVRFLRFDDLEVKMNMEGVLMKIERWIEENRCCGMGGGDGKSAQNTPRPD